MSSPSPVPGKGFTVTEWLILVVAIIGFAFDTYELLMLPVVGNSALAELLQVPPNHPKIRDWLTIITAASAVCGGIFGLLGGILIDRFGRKKILAISILVYAVSPVLAAFSTSAMELLIFRCTTFIGVCVEFVAAVAWLAELFPDAKKRETVLGFTQAFASIGGIMVTGTSILIRKYGGDLPDLPVAAPFDAHANWRYTLITGLIPAIPIMILLPFLPESPIWKERKQAGTLKRASLGEIFAPAYRRTTIVVTILFACAYGAAFGAIQLTPPVISNAVPELADTQKQLAPLRKEAKGLIDKFDAATDGDEKENLRKQIKGNLGKQKPLTATVEEYKDRVQAWQEIGGLIGRIAFAVLALVIVSRRGQLWFFLIPGLVIFPLVFVYATRESADMLLWGIGMAAFVTIAQFSYWGNYLPAAYPVHLRGTAGGFTANVGGRMIGGSMGLATSFLVVPWLLKAMDGQPTNPIYTSYAAAIVGGTMFLIAIIASFFLPEPKNADEV